jgi:hypothetical protein
VSYLVQSVELAFKDVLGLFYLIGIIENTFVWEERDLLRRCFWEGGVL